MRSSNSHQGSSPNTMLLKKVCMSGSDQLTKFIFNFIKQCHTDKINVKYKLVPIIVPGLHSQMGMETTATSIQFMFSKREGYSEEKQKSPYNFTKQFFAFTIQDHNFDSEENIEKNFLTIRYLTDGQNNLVSKEIIQVFRGVGLTMGEI
jgi:hypothetical protein